MKITRTSKWYRPYGVNVGGKGYYVNKIYFYDENGIICNSQSGWLESKSGRDIEEIYLPIEKIIRRNKEKFDGEVFGIPYKEYYEKDIKINLYIPAKMLNIHYEKTVRMFDTEIYDYFVGGEDILIKKWVKTVGEHLRILETEYEEAIKKISSSYLLKKEAGKIKETLKYLNALIEDYEKEYEKINAMKKEF